MLEMMLADAMTRHWQTRIGHDFRFRFSSRLSARERASSFVLLPQSVSSSSIDYRIEHMTSGFSTKTSSPYHVDQAMQRYTSKRSIYHYQYIKLIAMALSMTASTMMGAKVVAPQRTAAPRRAVAVSATLRNDVARFAKAAGVGAASLALALSAQAADVKLGLDNGGLVRL